MARAQIIIGIIAMVGVLVFGSSDQGWEGSRTSFAYATPLAPADMAAGMVIVMTGFWLARRTVKSMVVMSVALIFAMGTILMTGTRGPFFTLAAAFLMMVYLYRRQVNFKGVIVLVLFLGIAFFSFKYYLNMSSGGVSWRFSADELQKGFAVRVTMVKVTLEGWASSPIFGTGPGDFNAQMAGIVNMKYPHNVILEVANELGLVGLIPYLILLYFGLKGMKLLSRPELDGSVFKMYAVMAFGVFFYHFVASFKTGSYAGSYILYFSWGAAISLTMLGSYELMQQQECYEQDENEMLGGEITEQGQEIVL